MANWWETDKIAQPAIATGKWWEKDPTLPAGKAPKDGVPSPGAQGDPQFDYSPSPGTPTENPPAPLNFGQEMIGAGRALQQGLTLGYGDELGAASQATWDWIFGPGSWGENYDKRLQQGRELDQRFQEQSPTFSAGAEIAGSLLPMVMAPEAVVSRMGQTAGGQIARGAALGATLGGISGFGHGAGGLQNRLDEALGGAIAGGGLGAAVPAAAGLGGAAGRLLRNVLGAQGSGGFAMRKIMQAMERDGISLGQALSDYAKRRAAGLPDERLVDLGGKNTQDLARAAASVPGPGKQQAVNMLGADIANEPAALTSLLEKSLGKGSAAQTAKALFGQRMAQSKPLYEQALQSHAVVDTAPILQSIDAQLANAVGPQKIALLRIKNYLVDEASGQPKATIAQLHPVKLALDADYTNAGIDTAIGRGARSILRSVKDDLVGMMDTAEPLYKQARASWAGPSESLDAIDVGKNLFTMPEAELREAMAKMSPADMDFVKLGLKQGLEEQGNKLSDTGNLVETLFRRRGTADRLGLVFTQPGELDAFLSAVERLRATARTTRQTLPTSGSQTSLREADKDELASNALVSFGQDAARRGPIEALVNAIVLRPMGRAFGTNRGISEKGASALVDSLIGKVSPDLIQALLGAQAKAQRSGNVGTRLRLGTTGGLVGAYENLFSE